MKNLVTIFLVLAAQTIFAAEKNSTHSKTEQVKVRKIAALEKSNGNAIVADEFYADDKEQVRVRITGSAAKILCSSIGLAIDKYEAKSAIFSNAIYTCGTTSRKGEFWAGHIVRDGKILNLETDGYQ